MEPLKIKLTYPELQALTHYLRFMVELARHPQAGLELIVLAEYSPTIEKRLITAWRRDPRKPCSYTLPLSVARILHKRWQQEELMIPLLQMVLNALDYELTAQNRKPDPVGTELC
jgi:hypothetical protein